MHTTPDPAEKGRRTKTRPRPPFTIRAVGTRLLCRPFPSPLCTEARPVRTHRTRPEVTTWLLWPLKGGGLSALDHVPSLPWTAPRTRPVPSVRAAGESDTRGGGERAGEQRVLNTPPRWAPHQPGPRTRRNTKPEKS